ncbi:low molecular weight protein-tyrosine-phosphatase [Hoeflea olei]|uniref:protein-tyrosine-phosphatase n=1 Tax=Hoeflea olei TaxID=1480615 RepID=A0A1C1YZL1_9HYPH|nr:low molecular weight protein-tyrosine-phosphatase [Hoeflea olei]OCW58961.1 protein tyrosine phosphatase [Hoeflea olei]
MANPSVTDRAETTQPAVLFVCMGNICRSPLAEGVFRHALAEAGLAGLVTVDSAGTGDWHQGDAPDPRSIKTAGRHGIDISAQRARQVAQEDFDRFDMIFAMDRSNEATLLARAPATRRDRIFLFLDHTLGTRADVPDPYYGGADGFESVYQLLREGCQALASRLCGELRQPRG